MDKVYILMRSYISSFGRYHEPEVVDVYTDRKKLKKIVDEKNSNNNRKYDYSIRPKVIK